MTDLAAENQELRARLAEAQETIEAIRSGAVDALVTTGPAGEQVFTLQGAETPYRLLMESMNEGAATLAPDGTVLYCNRRFAEMAALPAEKIVGSSLGRCVALDQQKALCEMVARASTGAHKAEFTFSCDPGPGLPVLVSLSPIATDPDALAVVATDLSERKQHEEKLRQLNQELEAAVRHRTAELQAIFDAAPIGLAIARDPEARSIRGNPALEETFGLGRGEELSLGAGRPAFYRCLRDGREVPVEQLPMQRASRGETISGHVMDILRPDGRTITVYSNAVPLRDEQGRPRGSVGAFLDVTERNRQERALAEKARLLDLSYDAILVRDADDRITYWSKGAEELYGYSREEAWGKVSNELLKTEFPEPLPSILAKLRQGSRWTGELVHTRRDGTRVGVATRWALERTAQGQPAAILEINTDITERKQAETALRESERRLKRAQQIANVGSWEWDIATGALSWSEQMYRQTGQPADFTLTHDGFRQLLHPDDRAVFDAAVKGALAGTAPYDIECRIVRPDGAVRMLHTRGEVLHAPDGRPRTMVGVSLDITQSKQAEQALREAMERYERQVRLFEGVAATTPDFVYIFDLQGRFLYANRRLLEVWGMSLPDALGKTCRELGYEQWHHDMHMREIAQVIQTRRPIKGEVPFKAPLTGISGIYEYIFTPVIGPGGEVELIAGTTRDITEHKQAERDIFAANQRLQALMEALPVGASFSDDATCQRITGNPAVLAQFEVTAADNLSASAPDESAPGRQVRFFRDGLPMADSDLPLQRAVAENREIPATEFEVLLPSGRRWYAQGSGAPIRDQQGQVVGGIAVTVDITALKDAEAAFRSKEAELRAITELTPVMLTRCSRDLRYLYANHAYAAMVGSTPEQIIGKPIVEIMSEKGLAAIRPRVEQVLQGQAVEYEDKVHFALTGKSRWLHAAYVPDRDAHGQVVGWIASITDITERKQAEEALRRIEEERKIAEAIQVERQRFQDVLNMLPAYVVLLSPDYRVPFANRFFEERFGKANERHCHEYLFKRQEPGETCESFKVLQTHAPHRWERTGLDGRNYDISDFPFTDVDGSPLVMEVGLDVTERKKAEAELTRHREHLQELVHERTAKIHEANQELSRFNSAMVGRELRMIELKEEINALCTALGKPPAYPLAAEQLQPKPPISG